jgi:hypothetical protein
MDDMPAKLLNDYHHRTTSRRAGVFWSFRFEIG